MSYRVFFRALAGAAAIVTTITPPVAAQRTAASRAVLPKIAYTEFKLPNGLRVILHRDTSTPIVGVNVWYHVGSKNEVPGRTGFAHLFEHMMFQGSKNYDTDFFGPLQEAGGTLNGSTNPDRTNYWEIVPSNFLELALFLEADRMGGLLEAMTEPKLANQRDVVKNEKRQNYDNRPYGLVGARINERMYPPNHPYHWLTIGSLDDLTNASMDDVKNFFRQYYHPGNASLTIAGDFDPAEARRLVTRYFGGIPAGPKVTMPKPAQPALTQEIRDTMFDRVSLTRNYYVWHAVPQYHPDEAALDALASILGGGRSSRLYKTLVYEKQIAQDVNAGNPAQALAGRFSVTATAKPNASLAEIEQIIDAEIARLQAAPPTAEEVARFYNEVESNTIYSLQSVGGFGGKSDQLNNYAITRGTPGWFEEDLARYRKVTPADVQRVARTYLSRPRYVLTVLKGEKPASAIATTPARPAGAQPMQTATVNVTTPAGATPAEPDSVRIARQKAALPKGGPNPTFKLPAMQKRVLSNGLEVRLVEHHEMPVVGLQLAVRGGSSADGSRAGLATFTADLLDEGTTSMNALQLSTRLDELGIRFGTGSQDDLNAVFMLSTTRQFEKGLEIMADVIQNPAFADSDIERIRRMRLTALAQRRDNADAIAQTVFSKLLFGADHPYGHSSSGDEASLKALTRDDLVNYFRTYYRPNNATLFVVGDITMDALVPKLEKALGGWTKADVPVVNVSAPAPRDRSVLYLVDKPGAAQSVITIGQIGVDRGTPDYFPLLVMNTMLGGQFSSRLNMNLREDKGYSYGARSFFGFNRGPGPFAANAGVQTAVTKESVIEFIKELRGIRGDIPVTETELEFAKQSLIRGFPRTFETPEQIGSRLISLAVYGLPDNYYDSYIQNIAAVTVDDVKRVAQKYLDPDRMAFLVVGDRTVIEPGLRQIPGIGSTITLLDTEGNPVPATPPTP